MVHLYVEYLDVDLVEGDGPQHLKLGALDVEGEVVDGGVVQGQEDGVHGKALDAGCSLAGGASRLHIALFALRNNFFTLYLF